MQLSDAEIEEFAELWRQEFGEQISAGDARHRATEVLELYWLLANSAEGHRRDPDDTKTHS